MVAVGFSNPVGQCLMTAHLAGEPPARVIGQQCVSTRLAVDGSGDHAWTGRPARWPPTDRTPRMKSTSGAPQMCWRFDEFELDGVQHEVRRHGEPVSLEPQVFELLAYLIANHQRIVSRDELMDTVWGAGRGSDASLSTRIKEARRALGDSGESQKYIRTIYKRGYQFVAVPTIADQPVDSSAGVPTPAQRVGFAYARDGVRLAYGIAGSGPPLVRAANWMTHLGHDLYSPVWRHWVADLAARRRLIRYDERGCGLSDWDVGAFTFDHWVADLECVVDTLQLERFPLLGVAQGGAVAVAYAARHPERVSRLILVGTYAQGRSVRAVGETEHRLAALDIELARLGWGRSDPAFRQVLASQVYPGGTRADWDAFGSLQIRATAPDSAVRFLEHSADIDVLAQARGIQCPTLILHSTGDRRVPLYCALQLASAIPDARLVKLESDNHLLTAQEPAWQCFLREVDGFLGLSH